MSVLVRWVIPAVLLVAVAGVFVQLWLERRRPSSYTRSPGGDLAWWGRLPTETQEEMDDLVLGPGARLRQTPEEAEQERVDEAFLDLMDQARADARADAQEAADALAYRAQVNARFHP